MTRLRIEQLVAHRLSRQTVLSRQAPLPYIGYVHEAALRMQFGGRKVMQHQLYQLCEMSERPNITLRVIPVDCGAFPGAGHAMLYAEAAVPDLDAVELDSAHGPEFTFAENELEMYRTHLEWMDEATLSASESQDFIRAIARQL
jgi:hypothetical protein